MKRYLRRVNFLVFAGDEHGGDSEELQLVALDLVVHDVGVNDELGEEERFVAQVEPQVHIHQPVQQNSTHFLVYLDLLTHYIPQYYLLFLTYEIEYFLGILFHRLRVLLDFLWLQTQFLLFIHVYVLYFCSKLSEHTFLKSNWLKHLLYY